MTSSALAASLLPLYGSDAKSEPTSSPEGDNDMNKGEKANSLMQEYGSCCSGVLGAFAPELGIEMNTVAGLGRGMAGGIGGLGHVCGAVSGAILAIGLKMTNEENIHDMQAALGSMETVKEFVTRFEEQHSTILCRDLIGCDISSPEKSAAAMENGSFKNCPMYVESAAMILDEMFSTM